MPWLKHCLLPLLLLGLQACTQPVDNTIRFGLASSPANLDPRFATDATSARINRLLYQRLVDFDDRVRPVPALARWEQLGPQHYRFHLQPDRPAFHDGTPLRAHDVAATYRSLLAPGSGSPHAGTLRLITAIEILDDDTLDFRLSRPDPLLPGYLVIGILPAAGIAAGGPFHSEPLGRGPFLPQQMIDGADTHHPRVLRDVLRCFFQDSHKFSIFFHLQINFSQVSIGVLGLGETVRHARHQRGRLGIALAVVQHFKIILINPLAIGVIG